ncbi:MAG: hypothetical protein PF961_09540 [Planctomycetota bacterium]|jgi:hypothetical protein|nr:hypothetical protein [Planctomycetota bacterium]
MRLAGLLLVLTLAIPAGCYRGEAPPPLDETVAVRIGSNRARLVRSQAYLQDAVADMLRLDMGWQTGPLGQAAFTIDIEDESFDVVASGDLGIPERWRAVLSGAWTFDSTAYGTVRGRFSATAYFDDRMAEAEALRRAALSSARDINIALRRELARSAVPVAPEPGAQPR